MFIERVQIEEGFLDGLDLRFCEGLNTIIGERGTGKTSLVELIRFCLDIRGYSSDVAKRSRDHALSVLGSGQITVTLTDGQRRIVVSRTANDTQPRASGPFRSPIVFSQTEIESVGLQPTSRLQLIDSFLEPTSRSPTDDAVIASEIRSLSAEVYALRRETEELQLKLQDIPQIDKQLADLAPAELQLGKTSAEAQAKKQKLDALSNEISAAAVALSAVERFSQVVKSA